MLLNGLFERNLFDDLFEIPFGGSRGGELMRTDVREKDDSYELTVDLPGVKKEDIHAELNGGYLTISAVTGSSNEEKDAEGRFLRRERYSGSFSRSFYVGKDVTQADIKARFQDGVLTLDVPRMDKTPKLPQNQYIAIEG